MTMNRGGDLRAGSGQNALMLTILVYLHRKTQGFASGMVDSVFTVTHVISSSLIVLFSLFFYKFFRKLQNSRIPNFTTQFFVVR